MLLVVQQYFSQLLPQGAHASELFFQDHRLLKGSSGSRMPSLQLQKMLVLTRVKGRPLKWSLSHFLGFAVLSLQQQLLASFLLEFLEGLLSLAAVSFVASYEGSLLLFDFLNKCFLWKLFKERCVRRLTSVMHAHRVQTHLSTLILFRF